MPSYDFTKITSEKIMPYIETGRCVVLHHMKGCIHCEMFMPTWKKVCEFYTNKKDYMIVTVESKDMIMLPKSMQDVQGFPTLRAYNNTKAVEDFNDSRSYETVSKFIEQYGKNDTSSSSRSSSSSKDKKAKPKAKPKTKSESKPSSSKGGNDKKEKKEKK